MKCRLSPTTNQASRTKLIFFSHMLPLFKDQKITKCKHVCHSNIQASHVLTGDTLVQKANRNNSFVENVSD